MIRHSTISRGAAAAAIALFTTLAPLAANAEEGDPEATARARELFGQGVGHIDAERWTEAADAFEEALALRDAPTIRFNLATALARLDRPTEAAHHLDAVIADDETTDDLRSNAEELLAEVVPRTGSVEVVAEGLEEGATFALDGEGLTADQLGTAIRVDPGPHVATAALSGEEVARAEVDVAAGDVATARLEPSRTPVEEAIVDGAGGGGDEEAVPLVEDWRLWLGVGVGTAVVVTAIALGVGLGTSGVEDPVHGNMDPGVIVWR